MRSDADPDVVYGKAARLYCPAVVKSDLPHWIQIANWCVTNNGSETSKSNIANKEDCTARVSCCCVTADSVQNFRGWQQNRVASRNPGFDSSANYCSDFTCEMSTSSLICDTVGSHALLYACGLRWSFEVSTGWLECQRSRPKVRSLIRIQKFRDGLEQILDRSTFVYAARK